MPGGASSDSSAVEGVRGRRGEQQREDGGGPRQESLHVGQDARARAIYSRARFFTTVKRALRAFAPVAGGVDGGRTQVVSANLQLLAGARALLAPLLPLSLTVPALTSRVHFLALRFLRVSLTHLPPLPLRPASRRVNASVTRGGLRQRQLDGRLLPRRDLPRGDRQAAERGGDEVGGRHRRNRAPGHRPRSRRGGLRPLARAGSPPPPAGGSGDAGGGGGGAGAERYASRAPLPSAGRSGSTVVMAIVRPSGVKPSHVRDRVRVRPAVVAVRDQCESAVLEDVDVRGGIVVPG